MSATTIRKSLRVSGRNVSKGEMTISGLSSQDMEKIEGVINGNFWMIGGEEGLTFVSRHQKLPDPIVDQEIYPCWRPVRADCGEGVQYEMFAFDSNASLFSAGIAIESLCGHYYTPEKYKEAAEKLTRWGFACLRSHRDDNGYYHEIWYLPFLEGAREEFKEAIALERTNALSEDLYNKTRLEMAISFLRKNARFGSLDVSVQRAAMAMPDD